MNSPTLLPISTPSPPKYTPVSNTNRVYPTNEPNDINPSNSNELFSPIAEMVANSPKSKRDEQRTPEIRKSLKNRISEFTEKAMHNFHSLENAGDEFMRSLTVDHNLESKEGSILGMMNRISVLNLYIIVFFLNFLSVLSAIFTNQYRLGIFDENAHQPLKVIEWIVAAFFGLEIMLNFFIKKRTMEKMVAQFLTLSNLINILLIVEILTTTLCSPDFKRLHPIFTVIFFLRSFKLMKVKKVGQMMFKLLRKIMKNEHSANDAMKEQSEIRYFVYESFIEIAVGIFIEASFLIAMNELLDEQGYGHFQSDGSMGVIPMTYLSAMYYVTVSMTSIGYGDIYPVKWLTRITTVFLLFFDISILSKFIGQMTEHIYKLSPYIRNIHFTNHIVVIGDLPLSFLKYFLNELYQCDNLTSSVKKTKASKIIVVGKEDPPKELTWWIEDFEVFTEIKYLKSNSLENVWQKQANLCKARHLFAFSMNPNETQEQKFESDKRMSYNVRQVVDEFPDLEITLILSSDFSKQIKKDSLWAKINVISTESLNECIMANSLENQGLNVWLTHLSTLREKTAPITDKELKDLQEYGLNMTQEIYPIKLPEYFVGKTFKEASKLAYFSGFDISDNYRYDYSRQQPQNFKEDSGLLLIGIEYKQTSILINPINYIIQKNDVGVVVAFDIENAKKLMEYSEKSNEHSIFIKNMNYFKKSNIDQRERLLTKMAEHSESLMRDWAVKKEKYYIKTQNVPTGVRFENIEIPLIFNLFQKESPKGVFANHIIIKGTLDRFERIALVLRAYSERPILLFSEEEPNPGEWMKLQDSLRNIYYVYGSTKKVSHIMQVDPKKAFKILILSSARNNFLMDSESIIFTRIISDLFGLTNFLTEVMEENNMRYMSLNPKWDNNNFFFWPFFVRGSIHFSSLSMSIIAKSINNKKWFTFVRDLTNPLYSNYTSRQESLEQNSRINTIDVNQQIAKEFECYGQLQYFLMDNNPTVIAIGLVKAAHTDEFNDRSSTLRKMETISPQLKKGTFKFQLKKIVENFYGSQFVMTNPSALMPLRDGDRILVIGNIQKINRDGFYKKIVGSSFKLPTPTKSPVNAKGSNANLFNFEELDLKPVKEYQKKSIGLIKEKIAETIGKFNKLAKTIIA